MRFVTKPAKVHRDEDWEDLDLNVEELSLSTTDSWGWLGEKKHHPLDPG